LATAWLTGNFYDVLVTGGGSSDTLYQDVGVLGESTISNTFTTGSLIVYEQDTVRALASGDKHTVLSVAGTEIFSVDYQGGFTAAKASTITAGGLTLAADDLTFGAAASQIVPGATSLSFRNTADSADNLIITNAGAATIRAGLTITASGLTVTAGVVVYSTITTLADDATPSVSAGNHFITGGTTTITDFDDGVTGQVISVIAEHSVTITDGTNIFVKTGGNLAMAATDTLTLIQKADGKWYQLAYSDNT